MVVIDILDKVMQVEGVCTTSGSRPVMDAGYAAIAIGVCWLTTLLEN